MEVEILQPISDREKAKSDCFEIGNTYALKHGFKKGVVYNPNGRPKGSKSFESRMLELARKKISYKDINGKQLRGEAGDAIVNILFAKALKGDMKAISMVLEYTKQKSVIIKGDSENPISIENVTYARENINRILELASKARETSVPIENGVVTESTPETNNT